MNPTVLVRPSGIAGEDADNIRARRALLFLAQLMAMAKSRIDWATWIDRGGLDAEEFLECVDTGRWDPVLRRWEQRKAMIANRPAPTARDKHMRRLVTLFVEAHARSTSPRNMQKSRHFVRETLARVRIIPTPSDDALRRWRDRSGSFSPADETVIANALARPAGQLADYFVGLLVLLTDPSPMLALSPPLLTPDFPCHASVLRSFTEGGWREKPNPPAGGCHRAAGDKWALVWEARPLA